MSVQQFRLERESTINRSRVIRFWFNDTAHEGYQGDTLASALLANGVRLVARSFKYHRPRGIYTAGPEEPNALVQLEEGAYTEPNRRATEIEIYDGLRARSQNCWPSVDFDLGAASSFFDRLLPAGFYYKTFMWPRSFWMLYEKYIRRAAGLGRSPMEADPDCYDKTYAHCDVLIVGGGPAGIQAARAAGLAGARVILADERPGLGGSLLGEKYVINDRPAMDWVDERKSELSDMPEVCVLTRTTVTGYYDYNFLVANERVSEHLGPHNSGAPKERLWKIRARHVVLATGAIERPLVFADCDRPGVMLSSAIRNYIHRFSVLPGKRFVILTNNDTGYRTALDILDAGGMVAVIDIRSHPAGELPDTARNTGIRVLEARTITAVNYAKGTIRSVEVMQLSEDCTQVTGNAERIRCDTVGVSGGWNPTVHLFSQGRGTLRFCERNQCFVPDRPSRNNPVTLAGSCRATWRLGDCLKEGFDAGISAAGEAGFAMPGMTHEEDAVQDTDHHEPRPVWILPCEHPIGQGRKKHFHEMQNDATIADIALADREGFSSIEHLKRYTTTGMGTDQGKLSNLNALLALSEIQGVPMSGGRVTTYRPPYTPLTMGSIVGHDRRDLFLQRRKTPIHSWHDRAGAVYEDVGDWERPRYYPGPAETMHDAVQRECLAVRQSCGLLDASTLGKIDLQGRNCRWLLNMLYTNAWDNLSAGRCRYGLMLNEHGMVFDDGVTTCLDDNHYHMTTTTGGAARVMNWIEEWLQTEWPDLEVFATSVTEQWAVASLSGPNARALLSGLTDVPLDDASFPFMSCRNGTVAGIPARIFRISFTGELSFEINVPARYGLALWKALMDAGEEYRICPYGTEAMHVLRAEKGFIIAGQDTDGTVTPMDLGMDWIVSRKKEDFLGKRSFDRTDTARPGRKQLVGLLTEDPEFVIPEGTHVVKAMKNAPPMEMLGHVSSSYMSPNTGRSIALALIADGFNLKGQTLSVALMNGTGHHVTVTDPVFLR